MVKLLSMTDKDGDALSQTIATLADARRDDSGTGWSREFPELRVLLHATAEKRLKMVEEGTNATAIQAAIEVGRAVELPVERLDKVRQERSFDATCPNRPPRCGHLRAPLTSSAAVCLAPGS